MKLRAMDANSPPGVFLARIERAGLAIRALAGWRRLAVAFGAGALAALSFAPFYFLPFLALGFSIMVLMIDGSKGREKPVRSAFAAGWFFGFGFFLVGLYWMAFSFLVQAEQFAWMAPFAMVGLPGFLAFFWAFAAALCVQRWGEGWGRIFLFVGVWMIFEWLRGNILTGLPWNLPGQAFAGAAIGAQSAAWYGVYGLSLVVVFLSAAPAANWGRAQKGAGVSGALVSIAGAALLFGAGALRLALISPEGESAAFVRIVQPSIPQREKIDPNFWGRNFGRQLDLSAGALPADQPAFVIWPENGAPLLDESRPALKLLAQELPENAVLVVGAVRRDREAGAADIWRNSILVIPQTPVGRSVVARYDKHHLVPFGEYLPLFGLLNALGLAQLAPYGDGGFVPGDGPAVLDIGGLSFAPFICYEAIFTNALYPRNARPQWLLTVTNDAWFGNSSGPMQHLDMARLRAIESGLPMARAANTGVSALIDGSGKILHRLTLYESGKIDAPLPPPLRPTLYGRVGNGLFAIMLAACLGFGLFLIRKRRAS